MRSLKELEKKTQILLLAVFGFLFTGLLFYPYGLNWDSARTMSLILTDGHATVNNWLGWYFPLLWEVLYKITGIHHLIGIYINLIYWIGITILYLNIFEYEKRSLWWYIAFAWFPGTLMFIVNITNNGLMMVMLILGLALFAVYSNRKKWWWLALSIVTIIQCSFIRRESFVIVIPLIFILLFIAYIQHHEKLRAVVLSCITGLVVITGVFGTEKIVTSRLPNYDYMDALSITALHDMSAVTYMTGKMCIPVSIFKDEYADGKICLEEINNLDNVKDSIFYGDIMFHHIAPYMNLDDIYMIHMPRNDIFKFYSENLISWVKFRSLFAFRHFWYLQRMYLGVKKDNNMIMYAPKGPNTIQKVISYILPVIFGGPQFFLFLSLIVIILSYNNLIEYRIIAERVLLFGLIGVSILEILIVVSTSIAVQYRYLYPICVLQYLIFVYVLSRIKYKNIAEKLEQL